MYHGVMFLIPNSASPFNGITIQGERALFKEHVSCFTIAKYYKIASIFAIILTF